MKETEFLVQPLPAPPLPAEALAPTGLGQVASPQFAYFLPDFARLGMNPLSDTALPPVFLARNGPVTNALTFGPDQVQGEHADLEPAGVRVLPQRGAGARRAARRY